jgi:hypothetical protein
MLFKASLSKHDSWAVIAYTQAHLPRKNEMANTLPLRQVPAIRNL